MPIYEYRCEHCGHQADHLQKVSEKPLAKCPACGKKAYKKLLSAAGFQLKGSGWYATDFKGGPAKTKKTETSEKSEKSEKTEKTGGESSSTSSDDSPAPKKHSCSGGCSH